LMSLPLGMVVDMFVYSLVLPSSVFGMMHEEKWNDFLLHSIHFLLHIAHERQKDSREGPIVAWLRHNDIRG